MLHQMNFLTVVALFGFIRSSSNSVPKIELCDESTSEYHLTDSGFGSALNILFTKAPESDGDDSRSRRRSSVLRDPCKLKITAPETHIVSVFFADIPGVVDDEPFPKLEAAESSKNSSCMISIYLPENRWTAIWKVNPCQEGEILPPARLLTPHLRIVWNPPPANEMPKLLLRTQLVLTAIGRVFVKPSNRASQQRNAASKLSPAGTFDGTTMTKGRKSRKNRKEQCSKTRQENEPPARHDEQQQQQQQHQKYSFETSFDGRQIDEIKKCLGVDETTGVPLIVGAVVVGQTDLVRRLIKDGHQVNVTGPNKLTPLMLAVKTHNMEMIDVLCSRNADTDCVDQNGDNIFFLAAKNSSWDETELSKLWNRYKRKGPADVDRTNGTGNTLLHFAVKRQWWHFVDALIDCEADVDRANAKGVTPLMIASGRNDARLVAALLRAGADAAVEDKRGCTALCYAVAYVVTKRLGTTSRALELLVAEINGRRLTIDDYLERRLELIATPPAHGGDIDHAHTLATIVRPVLAFFVRHVQAGLDMLLELRAFERMGEALAKHTDQPAYLKEIFGCVFEIVRYCECCVNGGVPTIAETELVDRFVASGVADAVLDVLLRYKSSDDSGLIETALILIFVACDADCKIRSWLEKRFDDIVPFYQKFMSLPSVTYNFFCDEYHTQMIKQKVQRFRALMSDLESSRRESTAETDTPEKPLLNPIGYERKKKGTDTKSVDADERSLNENQIAKANSKRMRRKTKAWKAKVAKIRSADMAERIMQKVEGGGLSSDAIVIGSCEKDPDGELEEAREEDVVDKETEPVRGEKPLGHTIEWPTESAWELMKKLKSAPKRCRNRDDEKASIENAKVPESKTESSSEDVYSDAESDPNSGQKRTDGDGATEDAADDDDLRTESEYRIPNVKLENVVEPTVEFLTSIFDDIVARYEYFWQCDRDLGHPDFEGATPDGSNSYFYGTRDEQIEQLERFLPRMEQEYLCRLRQKFEQVIVKIRYLASVKDSEYYSLVEQIKTALLNHEIRGETVLTRRCCTELIENTVPDDYWRAYLDKDEYGKDDDRRRARQESEYLQQVAEIVLGKRPVDEEALTAVRKKTEDNAYHLISSIEKIVESGSSTSGGSSENGLDDLFPYTNELATNASESDKSADSTPKKILLNKYRNKLKPAQEIAPSTGFFHILSNKKNKTTKTAAVSNDCGGKSAATFFDFFSATEQSKFGQQIPSNFWQTLNVASQSQPYVSRWDLLINTLNNCTNLTVLAHGELRTSPGSWRSNFLISSGGSFGDVELGLDIHGRPLAVKRIAKRSDTVCKIIEAAVAPLLPLRHKHLLQYSICEGDDAHLYVASPLCELNMGEYLMCSKTSVTFMPSVASVVRQILFGVRFLHDHASPIVHGNLKPSNVLIDAKGAVRLAEFGVFRALYHTASPPNSSTIWFARETFESYKKSSLMACTTYSDIQVAGMLLHFVLTGGFHPFGILTDEILDNVVRGVTFLKLVGCELIDLVSWMLVYEPSERPSISQVLSHVYFWDDDRKWRLLLLCAGITQNGSQVTIPIGQLHLNLDTTAARNNIKGDWVSIVKMKFPGIRTPDEFSDTLSGVLRFLRKCIEDKQICGTTCNNIELQIFFLGAFPALPISLFRLLDMTGWLKNPIFKQFTVPVS